jgi:hypothetical protein
MTNLMHEMNVIFPLYLPKPKFVLKVCEDNQSCIAMTNKPKFTPQTKHIAIKYHHFRKHIKSQSNPDGFIEIEYCSTGEQLADIFSQSLFATTFSSNCGSELVALYHVMRECENCDSGDLATWLLSWA